VTIKVGLCGFTMSALRYPQYFPVVEVQQTFYQPPSVEVINRWRAQMPGAFEFTVKAWMLITHLAKSPTYRRLRRPLSPQEAAEAGAFRESDIVDEGWRVSLDAARRLRATKMLFQTPASFKPTAENLANMRRFFTRIERPVGMRMMFEPRGPAWTSEIVKPLVGDLDLVHVVDPFVGPTVSRDLVYYRLHGVTGTRHVYTNDELQKLVEMTPDGAYVMFNNIPRVGDAERFKLMLTSSSREPSPSPSTSRRSSL
jgi:uncharacterized protein YecE (DUF72 family)